ncbi:hypothetical protein B0F90DRAFT_295366 [Multifurca ochricompacta]|uniref:Uncharacterized protein n=1 Tax=Multifurca ochricompacta TaxID=376703 RepID=A0AAD4M6W1_9AGAM|nr:hypothetical protein B0F90DRAFT_295366 [Multifurca ochricompacta]
MYHNQQVANTPDLLNPLEIEVATLAQSDAHCHSFSRPYADENAYRYQEDDENAGRFQVPLPGGASIFMKDPVGTSLSLNLDIDASSGTPILSGRAINAQGNVLDVHSCSCDNPSSVRHKLPLCGGLESSPNRTHVSPFPKSPFNHHRRPAPIFTRNHTPLIVVQTRLPHSPSESEFEQRPSVSVPEVSADTLGSPFTPTLASMQCIFQTSNPSPNPNPNHSFHTPPACFEVTSAPHMSPDLPELPLETPTSLYEVPPRLNTQSEQSPFDIDLTTRSFSPPLLWAHFLTFLDLAHSARFPHPLAPLLTLPHGAATGLCCLTLTRLQMFDQTRIFLIRLRLRSLRVAINSL